MATASSSNNENQLDADTYKQECGVCLLRPKCMQRFASSKWILFWLCIAAAVQGMLVNGLMNVIISSIERRFGLRSSESGLISRGFDIAAVICLIPVSYYGGSSTSSKPKWIALGLFIMGLGCLLFVLPHFIVEVYHGGPQESYNCAPNATFHNSCSVKTRPKEKLNYFLIFFIGKLVVGVGATPLSTLGVAYINENVSQKMSTLFLGFYYSMSFVGPALGFWVGGEILKVYTNFLSHRPEDFGLKIESRNWVGAWWVGILTDAVLCFTLICPIAALPYSLPDSEFSRQEEDEEGRSAASSQFVSFQKLKDFPRAFCQLMVLPAYIFLCLAGASEGFLVTGFLTFMPKVIENQYSISAGLSSILMGVFTVPSGGGGLILGGFIVNKWNLSCEQIQKLCIYCTIIAILLTSCFFLSCPNSKFAGVNVAYAGSLNVTLLDPCNGHCQCSLALWEPVCGIDGLTYYSPCHAGCKKAYYDGQKKSYSECSCIKPHNMHSLPKSTQNKLPDEAFNSYCNTECGNLWPFIFFAFCLNLCTFVAAMPAVSAILRYVSKEHQAFAIGIQWLIVRLFGTIPGPLVFGSIIDTSCILWEKDSCGNSGSCHVYDNLYMSRYLFGISVSGKMFSLLFFFCAWWFSSSSVRSGHTTGQV